MVIIDGNIKLGGAKKWSTQDLEINVEGKELTILYKPNTTRTFYNVSDYSGRVIVTGSINENGITKITLNFAQPENYHVTVIDGENVSKAFVPIN
ncbi:hypothetical protein N9R81_04515 [Flavobacteriales bacterium]|nr:hypothetical protein [Flavobacteriales bacterium]